MPIRRRLRKRRVRESNARPIKGSRLQTGVFVHASHSPKAGELRLELRAQVLETCRLPLTNSPEMPAGRLELPKASKDRLVYSQVQLPLCDAGQTRNSIVKQQKERVLSALSKRRNGPLPLSLLSNCCFEILGAGIRSRWINSGDVNNRRNRVLPISCCLWYSRSRAN